MDQKEQHLFETRQLNLGDYDQIVQLIDERFATTVEFSRIKKKAFGHFDEEGFADFKAKFMEKWCKVIREKYVEGVTHKLFGSFTDQKLMSMVGLRLVNDHAWVLSNLKAKNVPVSETGLQQTMSMLYQHAKDIGLKEYYCGLAEYRYEKFQIFMRRLVPEYYNEYTGEILGVIPAGQQSDNDFWWGIIGRVPPVVNTLIKKMTLNV